MRWFAEESKHEAGHWSGYMSNCHIAAVQFKRAASGTGGGKWKE